ncbi:MAG: recombinase family protein [Bryobacteraceae bacterium]
MGDHQRRGSGTESSRRRKRRHRPGSSTSSEACCRLEPSRPSSARQDLGERPARISYPAGTTTTLKLDRLTRSVKDLGHLLERLEKRGVALVSVAESLDTRSAAGRLVITIMTAVSQWEREAIGERTRDAMRHKRANGECVGNVAYGYRLAMDGERVEPEPTEQAVLAAIGSLRARHRTLREVAAELNGQGYRTRRGSPWRHEYVKRLINAETGASARR